MCCFKSALVLHDETRKGGIELFFSPWTESHHELALMRGLKDLDTWLDVAKVEYSPPSPDKAAEVDEYVFKLDQERTPDWWTNEIREDVIERLKTYIRSIIVTGYVVLLIGGQFIVTGKARVETVKTCMIYALCDSAKIGLVCGSAKIGSVCDSANIDRVYDSAKIDLVYGSAKIGSDNMPQK